MPSSLVAARKFRYLFGDDIPNSWVIDVQLGSGQFTEPDVAQLFHTEQVGSFELIPNLLKRLKQQNPQETVINHF